MRWAIIGASGTDTLEAHLEDTLFHLGHDVQIFDIQYPFHSAQTLQYWLRRFSDKYDTITARHVALRIINYKPDMVIGTYRHIHPLTIELIKAKRPSTIVMHINPDHLGNLMQQQVMASNYDFLFMKDPFMVSFMRDKAGLNAHYLPEAFNPRMHKAPLEKNRKLLELKEGIDVMVFGNLYPYRVRLIQQMIKAGLKVKLFGVEGPFFPAALKPLFTNRVILGQDKSERTWGAKIVLNNFHYAEIESVNVKYFEIHGMGGFQICDFKPTLTDYSPVDPAKYSFKSFSEAIELIRYYLDHEEERHSIAELQYSHFIAHHTYENRIEQILKLIQTK